MMFQLASSEGSTGPRAFSISAGSASVLSPNPANGPLPALGVPPPIPPSFVSPSSPPQFAATRAISSAMPMILSRCMSFSPSFRWRSPSPVRRTYGSVPPFSSGASGGRAAGASPGWSPAFSEHMFDAADDPIARDQHPSDDHQAEDHGLERRGEAHRPQHLVQPREEQGRHERRERAGQAAGQGGAADHDGGDRTQEVLGA